MHARIALAAGCFWGAEARLRAIAGVVDARVGWTGGDGPAPDAGGRCHAEVVEVVYDPRRLPLDALLDAFLAAHDATDATAQEADGCGLERSAIFVADAREEAAAHAAIARAATRAGAPIVTAIEPAGAFIEAPADQQRYLERQDAACRLAPAAASEATATA